MTEVNKKQFLVRRNLQGHPSVRRHRHHRQPDPKPTHTPETTQT